MPHPLTGGTHGQEKGTGIQKQRERTCVNVELLPALLWRWSLGGILRCLQHLREKKNFLLWKKIVLQLRVWGSWGKPLPKSPMFQVQVETPHKPVRQTIIKRNERQNSVTRAPVGILYPNKQLRSWIWRPHHETHRKRNRYHKWYAKTLHAYIQCEN